MTGSPPPMRGKGIAAYCHARGGRITPAYAGKSIENNAEAKALYGSPPPMRGKVRHFASNCRNNGITPAYAGKRAFQ